MSKSYKVAKKTINMGEKKGQTLFSVRPYSYGTLTTEEVANQIAVESTATPADVKAVLDRYAYYVKENLKKGYDIELLGFGKLFIRFITGKAVEDESKANAKLVKSLVPAFRPSFTKLQNGTRLYNLIPSNSSSTVKRRRIRLPVERHLAVKLLVVRPLAAVPAPRLAELVPTMVTDWNSLQLWQCLTSLKRRHCLTLITYCFI